MTLELLTGGDAEDRVRLAGGGLPEAEILQTGRDIAHALTALHAKGYIHRDLKPGNMIYSAQGLVKLGDFGCAREKNVSEPITTDGMILGTPDYMSPEQARGENDIDQRTDIYSLGATLYYLATAHTPFEGTTAWGIIGQVINHPFPDPRRKRPTLSEGFAGLILAACAKDRTERYPDSAAFAADSPKPARRTRHQLDRTRARSTSSKSAARARSADVLLIDDDPIISRIYLQRLRQDGFDVGISATGAGALHTLSITSYDCVLLDLGLPDMDGIVLKACATRPRTRAPTARRARTSWRIPVIALPTPSTSRRCPPPPPPGRRRHLAKSRVSPREVAAAAVREVIAHGRLGVARRRGDGRRRLLAAAHAPPPTCRSNLALAVDNMGSNGWPCIYALEIQSTCPRHRRARRRRRQAPGGRDPAPILQQMLVRHLLRRPGDFQESTAARSQAIAAIRAQLQAPGRGHQGRPARAGDRRRPDDHQTGLDRAPSSGHGGDRGQPARGSRHRTLAAASTSATSADINMPEISGRDLLKRLRKTASTPACPS